MEAELQAISLNPANLKMNGAARAKLRQSLAASIKDLKEKELMAQIAANDPLLN